MTRPLTRRSIFAQAWPIIIGQASVPFVAIVDTAVIGQTGDAIELAGVALGSIVITFIFWTFGFLRMGMTGLTAQAEGAGDGGEVDAMLLRGLAIGFGLGLALFALQWLLTPLALGLLAGGGALDEAARGYIDARFLGAPASLAVFALTGWLFGLGATRRALALQIVMNLVNAGLDILFVWEFGMGARGVGLGTAIAEWVALATGIALCAGLAGPHIWVRLREPAALFARSAMKRLFTVNFDIMVRTIALLILFAWFTNAGARLGPVQLGANLVLDQFILVAAYVLDAFAFTAESRVGMAVGRGSRAELLRAARLTGEFSLGAGILFAIGILLLGAPIVDLLTANEAVRAAAYPYIWMVALIPLIGMPAWLLDGIFIGATRSAAFRNAAIAATLCYIATDIALRPWEAFGLWLAMLTSYVFRAGLLAIGLPALLRTLPPPLAQAPRPA